MAGSLDHSAQRDSGAVRAAAAWIASILLIAACSGGPESANSTKAPGASGGNEFLSASLELPLPAAVDRRFTLGPKPAGRWETFTVPEVGRVLAIVEADTGPVAVIAAGKRNPQNLRKLRLYEPNGDGWEPLTDWVGPNTDQELVWKYVSVLDGSIVVVAAQSGPDGFPVSFVLDPTSGTRLPASPSTGDSQLKLKDTTAGDGFVLAISTFDRERFAVWQSPDGLNWETSTLTANWPERTRPLLELVRGEGDWAIAARNQKGAARTTHFVMTSRDGIDWRATAFAGPRDRRITELRALGTDGSVLLALGTTQMGRPVIQTSNDGETWLASGPTEAGVFGDWIPRFSNIMSHPDGGFLAGTAHYNTDYRHCYVAGRACLVELEMLWMADNGMWMPIVAPSDVGPTAVASIADTLYVGGERNREPVLITWVPDDESGALPVVSIPADAPPPLEAQLINDESTLLPGTVYAWHGCEGCARFNGVYWEIESVTDDAAEILAESGAVGFARAPCGGGGPVVYGTVELIAPRRIEWSVPGHGPIAYLQAGDPVPEESMPGCL